jgi:hypothetical protein
VVLVPFADFLNHDPSCHTFLKWDEQQQAVVLRPDRSYAAGEQVRLEVAGYSAGRLLVVQEESRCTGVNNAAESRKKLGGLIAAVPPSI